MIKIPENLVKLQHNQHKTTMNYQTLEIKCSEKAQGKNPKTKTACK
jgi:hypothetical protein